MKRLLAPDNRAGAGALTSLSVMVAAAIVTGIVVAFVALYFLAGQPFRNPYPGGDFAAYWDAAERLRDGSALYPHLIDPGAGNVYRYAPWFAVAWIPFTFLPREAVLLGWQLVLLAAGILLMWPLLARPSLASVLTAALMVPLFIDLAWVGNVEALMVLAIALSLRRPIAGPIAVGLAASLKVTPLAFIAFYVARRQWTSALLAGFVAAILWLPAIPLGLANYPTEPLSTIALWGPSPLAGAAVAIAAIVITGLLALTRSRWTTLAAAVVTLAASPRLYLTNLPQLLVAVWTAPEADNPTHRPPDLSF